MAIDRTIRCSAHLARLIDALVARIPGMTADEVVRRALRKQRRACGIPHMCDFATYGGSYFTVRLSQSETNLAEGLTVEQLRCIVLYQVERAAAKALRHDAVNEARRRIEAEQKRQAAQLQLMIARAQQRLAKAQAATQRRVG